MKLMSLEIENIPRAQIMSDPIDRFFDFRFESAKESIEDNQSSSIILIQILSVTSMMHSVMRRCVENELDGIWELVNHLRVNPNYSEQRRVTNIDTTC